jgi:hypothetical protein
MAATIFNRNQFCSDIGVFKVGGLFFKHSQGYK